MLADIAIDLLREGLSIVPVAMDKRPMLPNWKLLQQRAMQEDYAAEAFLTAYGVAVVCGAVSGNLEAVDFDGDEAPELFRQWSADEGVADIMHRNGVYIETTPRGGVHVLYRCEVPVAGNLKLAHYADGKVAIETRGEGGYIIVAPTPAYNTTSGDLLRLPTITSDERDYLISHARNFDRARGSTSSEPVGVLHQTDPVSLYNWTRQHEAKRMLMDNGWVIVRTEQDGTEHWRRPGKTEGTSATWGKRLNALYVFSANAEPFETERYYTPFEVLTVLRFKGNWRAALASITPAEPTDYIRVGADYFKRIVKQDRWGIQRAELKAWKKDEIKLDHGKQFLEQIPRFDDFCIVPSNTDYVATVDNCYNLYRPFAHRPEPGAWHWSGILMRHIFGNQYQLGMRYMQALYLHPYRMLPILVLVSRERQTGKTTFINWLSMIFGSNVAMINPEDLTSSFNSSYATANIIAVEETLLEKSVTVEKLKALATGKYLSVNQKFVQPYRVPFFGKIILASNNEEKFARIDQEEVRFFVRKVPPPTDYNHNIEADLQREIPAFLHHLSSLPPIDWSVDRSGFRPDELANEQLTVVKDESHSWLFKDLRHLFAELFLNHPLGAKEVQFTPTDIKMMWYRNNSKVDINYIASVLRNEFKLSPSVAVRYQPFDLSQDAEGRLLQRKVGKVYTLNVSQVIDNYTHIPPEGGEYEPAPF